MDGIHDLGGKQGFGRIDVGEDETPFHEPWEARLLGIVRAMQRAPDWTIDRFRYTRECIDPVDYLQRPYFDQWLQTYAALMIGSGVATIEELATGHSNSGSANLGAPMAPQAVATTKKMLVRFDRPVGAAPRFAVGDRVRARTHGSPGHTRLPAYVRGRIGEINRCHGAHVLPDANARGIEESEPLYTVAFAAEELWPEAKSQRDRVFVDLWESYLARE
ncbi:MAG: nitrile hydratase subunit beta [Pseudomonadota bacterium]|nr:nitrile hydratase subunit beta [Pseudomonadota bacterium]